MRTMFHSIPSPFKKGMSNPNTLASESTSPNSATAAPLTSQQEEKMKREEEAREEEEARIEREEAKRVRDGDEPILSSGASFQLRESVKLLGLKMQINKEMEDVPALAEQMQNDQCRGRELLLEARQMRIQAEANVADLKRMHKIACKEARKSGKKANKAMKKAKEAHQEAENLANALTEAENVRLVEMSMRRSEKLERGAGFGW